MYENETDNIVLAIINNYDKINKKETIKTLIRNEHIMIKED